MTYPVEVDGIEVDESGPLTCGCDPVDLDIDGSGRAELKLLANPLGSNNSDQTVWADVRFACNTDTFVGSRPEMLRHARFPWVARWRLPAP
ncbi:MAG: NPCBM/NEW2 domain-containing protein [Pseudomonadota bacterium]